MHCSTERVYTYTHTQHQSRQLLDSTYRRLAKVELSEHYGMRVVVVDEDVVWVEGTKHQVGRVNRLQTDQHLVQNVVCTLQAEKEQR